MDRTSELTDAFVEIRFADYEPLRTQVCKKTLSPVWNEDFRFEISNDDELQKEHLELRVLDYDAYSANDIVGLVNIDLNPMLAENQQITGWFPIHDTLKGIRGELNILIRWQYFGDVNPFKESALGVQFFACSSLPFDKAGSIIGLVDVITSEDDPEKSHWSDNFRTPRFSNEARQKLLFRLSGYLRNEVAKKVVEMGGNAVIGYTPSFDIENEDRYITARAIGTACKIITPESVRQRSNSVISTPRFIHVDIPSSPKLQPSFVDPDSPFTNDDATHDFPTNENQVNSESSSESRVVKVPELLFLTIKSFPVGAILKIGGVVSAKSIKILQGGDSDIRDTWWTELRDEIKSHARALGCPHVIGYSEKTTIENDLCVFSAVGTAAILDLSQFTKSLDIKETLFSPNMKRRKKKATTGCFMTHIPYTRKQTPFPMNFSLCQVCGRHHVPEILLTTIEPPEDLMVDGSGQLISSHVFRLKKHQEGELNAANVGDVIPFLEYDMHRQLVYKLKLLGYNSIFGLRFQVSIGETAISVSATGTALYLLALPLPTPLSISSNIMDSSLDELVQLVTEKSTKNCEARKEGLDKLTFLGKSNSMDHEDSSDSEPDTSSLLSEDETTLKDTVVIQIDDHSDKDILHCLLLTEYLPDCLICNVESMPRLYSCFNKVHTQFFTMVKQVEVEDFQREPNSKITMVFNDLFLELMFNTFHFKSSLISSLNLDVHHPTEDIIFIRLSAYVMGVLDKTEDIEKSVSQIIPRVNTLSFSTVPFSVGHMARTDSIDEMITKALEQQQPESNPKESLSTSENNEKEYDEDLVDENSVYSASIENDQTSAIQNNSSFSNVEISPLSFLPDMKTINYIGHLSLHFVKEDNFVETGTGTFVHNMMLEIHAMIRSHVSAFGGNALLSFRMNQNSFDGSVKNKAYGLVSITGDIAFVEFDEGYQNNWSDLSRIYLR